MNDNNLDVKKQKYRFGFKFNYGELEDGTFWIQPPTNNVFHIDPLSLRIILELNTGAAVNTICKKYSTSEEEVNKLLQKFEVEKAIVYSKYGRINRKIKQDDISLAPFLMLLLLVAFIQVDYFSNYAKTFLLDRWYESLVVGLVAVAAVFFHEAGHYLVAKKYFGFKPKYGFTFLFIFPAVYVDTHVAWTLPRNKRLLINASGVLADMLVNTMLIIFVAVNRKYEYFVTPLLIMQYTRLTIVLNPLFSGDGYWLLSDFVKAVNLRKTSIQNLIRLRLNLYSLFGLLSAIIMFSSSLGFAWYLYNLLRNVFVQFV